MPNGEILGRNLFGGSSRSGQPYKYGLWKYLVSIVVAGLAVIYAMSNLYAPDYAIQIQTDNAETEIGTRFLNQAIEYLETEGVEVKAGELVPGGAQIRIYDDETQLRARALLERRLNPIGRERQFVIALNLAPTTPDWLQSLGSQPMTLGLDLAGGIHFVLQVNMESAIKNQLEDELEKIKNLLREDNIRYVPLDEPIDERSLRIAFSNADVREQAFELIETAYSGPNYEIELLEGEYPTIQVTTTEDRIEEIEDISIEQNLTGLRSRVNELGVAEPLVQRLGSSRIVIDLPGVQDSSEAKRIIDKFATLEFRLVAFPGDRPSQIEVMEYEGRDVRIRREIIITGDNVTNAFPDRDAETSLPRVAIQLDSEGGEKINEATAPNIGHQMAIVFIEQRPVVYTEEIDGEIVERTRIETDRRLISVATIQGALTYNSQITGISARDAQELALLLRAGALAAPMYFVEERTVGASLGQENIDRGMLAVVAGLLLVLLFMLVYFKVFGFVANIALVLNLVILIAIMSVLEATLTLPGIAGIVLTVGMAVDANVLIFSRIKEELKVSPPALAIQNGYDRAFLTILDANVTTLFVALILLTIGSGPVAGFAVTLSIGIVTSMFTAVFVSRGIVHLLYGRPSVKKVWI